MSFGGCFLIHDARPEPLEGGFPGHLVIIAFPDRARVRAWYDLPLPTRRSCLCALRILMGSPS
ncbi:DUF1330 domain-containing protein [Methylobacterium variabile]|uniref:DUF1330 domain-containing protein n=1 Tax=Methylobacterium variabile TaxID=298794 RepID=UPI003159321C